MNLSKQILGSSLSLPAYERAGQTQHLFFWRRISQSEIRNSAAAEKSESESEGGQKLVPCRDTGFLPPNPLPFCPPERSVWRAPARRSLGAGGKRAVNSVQKRFGFRQTNAQLWRAGHPRNSGSNPLRVTELSLANIASQDVLF